MRYETLKRTVSCLISYLPYQTRNNNSARILLYHSVGKKETCDTLGLRVPLERFTAQMEYLSSHSYHVVSLSHLTAVIKKGEAIQPKTIAITFDDGYRDNLEQAAPALIRHNFPATIFINCNKVSSPSTTDNGNYWNKWGYLSLTDLGSCIPSSITIGSHAMSHERLTDKGVDRTHELLASKEVLEEASGKKIDLFSYPHGIFNDNIKEILVKTGYLSACCSIQGINTSSSDLFELKRTEITTEDTLKEFERKIHGYYDWIGYFQRRRLYR